MGANKDQLIHGMHNIAGVGNFSSETAAAEIHQMIEVNRDVPPLSNGLNPTSAVIAAVRSIVNALGQEVHQQKRFQAAGKLFGRNYAQYLRLNSVGTEHDTSIDSSNHLLGKRVIKPFTGIRVIEIDRGVVNNPRPYRQNE